jgi:hypothetical protein
LAGCSSLSTIAFEPDSRLSWVELEALTGCHSLSEIRIPASLQTVLSEYQTLLKLITPEDTD